MGTQMGAHLTLKIGDIIRLNYIEIKLTCSIIKTENLTGK